jgi:HlyD family secretion protein
MSKLNKKWKIVIAIIAALLILKIGAGIIKKNKGIEVAAEEAKLRNIIQSVGASGKLHPLNEVKISADASGELVELYVEEGDSVTKGQALAVIKTSSVASSLSGLGLGNAMPSNNNGSKAELKQLQNQLSQAKQAYAQAQLMYANKVIDQAALSQASTLYNTVSGPLQASISAMQASTTLVKGNSGSGGKTLTLYAPISGRVSKLNARKGERVVGTAQMTGTEIMRIANMSTIKLDVEIGENDIQKINIGDSAIVKIDAYPKEKFIGIVSKVANSNSGSGGVSGLGISANIGEQLSNYTVSIELNANSYASLTKQVGKFPFRPGMSASADILTEHKLQILSVPINAVTTRTNVDSNGNEILDNDATDADDNIKEYVFVLQTDNTVKLQQVSTDVQDFKYIEISSGLKVGDKIIYYPYEAVANTLKNKDKVSVVAKEKLLQNLKKDAK